MREKFIDFRIYCDVLHSVLHLNMHQAKAMKLFQRKVWRRVHYKNN